MHPLITANQLKELINSGANILICDCRFELSQPDAGRKAYQTSHISGSIYVDLDKNLSGTKTGKNGRHPLPSPDVWAQTRQSLGIAPDIHVVAYDNHGTGYASRLWWMLRATGQTSVQVLNGGLEAWNGPTDSIARTAVPLTQKIEPRQYASLVIANAILENIASKNKTVIDARASDRYHGQNETLDPVGGHIPGALNRFYQDNLAAGQFKSPDELHKEFVALLGNVMPSDVIHQCGSGVTGCHNLLAMECAGLSGSRLYAGSWSEWCSDSSRPIEL